MAAKETRGKFMRRSVKKWKDLFSNDKWHCIDGCGDAGFGAGGRARVTSKSWSSSSRNRRVIFFMICWDVGPETALAAMLVWLFSS